MGVQVIQLTGTIGLTDSSLGVPELSEVDKKETFTGVIGAVGGVPSAKGTHLSVATEDARIEEEAIRLETKPWNRLDKGLRIRKIREWVDECNEYPAQLCDEIRVCLERAIKSGKLNKNSSVEYNTTTRKVISVPALKFYTDETFNIRDTDETDETHEPRDIDWKKVTEDGTLYHVFIRETDKTIRRKKI